jgi:hypothetical protein
MSTPNVIPAEPALVALIESGTFLPITDDCSGCGHIRSLGEASFCKSYANPERKWTLGMCNFATHKRIEKTEEARSLNPLKASKRGGH